MKTNIVKMSLVAAMLLGSSVYAGKIVTNADLKDVNVLDSQQFGFGGWNLDNVEVKIVDDSNFSNVINDSWFNEADGSYSDMNDTMSFESEISTGGEIRGLLHGKDWPVGEPAGIKVINGDMNTKNGRPNNCIMTSSYLEYQDMDNITSASGYLNTTDTNGPNPVICSSPFQTHKRFKVNMMPSTVEGINSGYGKPIDLVFDLVDEDASTARYQVLQKINNYTGKRLDGYKIEVLDAYGENNNTALTLSLGIGEHTDKDGEPDGGDIFDHDTMANFSHGLWGPVDKHFANPGFFDATRAYYEVSLSDDNQTISHEGPMSGGNYQELFGNWLTNAWAPTGIFYDDDMNPATDAKLVAFWGDPQHTGTNAWHKGKTANWAVASETDLLIWSGEWYGLDKVEDVLNLGLNYIVNVGDNAAIGGKFTIRITPHVDENQTLPPHAVAPLAPTTLGYEISEGIIVLDMQEVATTSTGDEKSAAIHDYAAKVTTSTNVTLKNLGAILVGVADHDLNQDPNAKETITIAVKSDHGEIENVLLTESGVDTSRFTGTLEAKVSNDAMVNDDGKFLLNKNTKLTATYVDRTYGTRVDETLEAVLSIEVAETPTEVIDSTDSFYPINSSSGGGCVYNPTSRNFDMSFLFMMALGLLYPFRRRFIK